MKDMPNINYRTATVLDLPQLKKLGLTAYGQFQNVLDKGNWEQMKANLADENNYLHLLKVGKCFVGELENQIVGMAFYIPNGNPSKYFESNWSYIRHVGVHPKMEGNGIGRKLVQQCIDFARESGLEWIALHTSEFQNAARHLYESLGFTRHKDLGLNLGKNYYLYLLHLN